MDLNQPPSQMSNQADLQRALEMANRTSVRLDSHLTECTARYEAMVERGNERHQELSGQITKISMILVSLAITLGCGLCSIIVMLIHGGGHL